MPGCESCCDAGIPLGKNRSRLLPNPGQDLSGPLPRRAVPCSGTTTRSGVTIILYKGSKGGSLNIANKEAWTFSNNCWPDGVPDLAKDPASFKADPQFVKPDDTTADGFKLAPTSPCLGKALFLAEVPVDHWGTQRRKTQPCVGLHEWMPPGARPEGKKPEQSKPEQPKKGKLPFVP